MTAENNSTLKHSPLYAQHVAAGARMVTFAGWEMPVQYSSIIAEHLHTRSQVTVFDTSHMGELFVRGPRAADALEKVLTCRVANLEPGQCRYCLMLRENGGIIDDLIVFRTKQEEFVLVVNAGTREKDFAWVAEHVGESAEVTDESEHFGKVDVQGPESANLLRTTLQPENEDNDPTRLRLFRCGHFHFMGADMLISRTGYTGELGYELFFPTAYAEAVWTALLRQNSVQPAGLGARDTLRLEKGLRLYGQDMDEQRTPMQANLGRFVDMNKDFIGRTQLLREKEEGVPELLMGFTCDGRRSARPGSALLIDNEPVGTVTSGAYSPSLQHSIGMCYVTPTFARDGQDIVLNAGRTQLHGRIVSLPILKKQS